MYKLPINPNSSQKYKIPLYGVLYEIVISVNYTSGGWDISIFQNSKAVCYCVPLLQGVDIVSQYHLPFMVFLNNRNGDTEDPTKDNLHVDFDILIVTEEELNESPV